jgi:universal stress protein A
MFSIDTASGNYLRVSATGRLSSRDYRGFEPAFEDELAGRGGRVPLLLDVTGWRGWSAGGLVRDLRFDLQHRHSFSRIAVVGKRAWHRWLTVAAKPVFSGPMRYFDRREEGQAVEWLEL